MKILSKEEEAEHYSVVVKAGLIGGTAGLGVGLGGVLLASKRYPAFRQLTLPFRSFLVTSSATFGAIVHADRESIRYGKEKDPMYGYQDATARAIAEARANVTTLQKFKEWGRENRYSIVFASWLASMGGALAMVGHDKYLTGSQKLVQARVYAQGLAVAMLVITAAFEMNDAKKGTGRWETVMIIDPDDPEHKHLIEKKIHKEDYEGQDLWKDMVAAEERRIAARKAAEHK
ncbi:Respiratory supercomplex factor 2-like protein [Colletotrichum shisoi]|uniref:Respiratory supercomplex factor 2-like protein n=1 Tax=Colletotrichum shisoi TaxID=2078593 RepID=A0A5Q4BVD3_9PEZI|nr:Respiratory supercomplex factor 2-like protein [Colletotrichum shisoi]